MTSVDEEWEQRYAAKLAHICKLKLTPGFEALLQRALIELRSQEMEIETVIHDDSLADDIESALKASHGQGSPTPA